MSAALEAQKALRTRLVQTSAVTSLVPASAIVDRNARPAPSPSIVMGEAQAVDEGDSIERSRMRVYHTLHVWQKDNALTGVAAIAGAMAQAVKAGRLVMGAGYHCIDALVSDTRTMRDPDGAHSHAVVTVEILVQEGTP